MTEAEWLASEDPDAMLGALRVPTLQTPLPERKSRLFGLACCDRISRLVTDVRSERALSVLDRYTEGEATIEELVAAFEPAFDVASELVSRADENLNAVIHAAYAISDACHPDELAEAVANLTAEAAKAAGMPDETPIHVAFVRDIFANPFRPATFSSDWRTSTVISLASQMYDSRDFGAMPILADALQDAGCTSDDILNHCRDVKQPHVRGCWVVDLVLGKE